MGKRKIIVGAVLISLLLVGAGCDVASGRVGSPDAKRAPVSEPAPAAPAAPNQLLGGDRDEHGCIGSAGYSWCEAKQKCLRIWEEKCQ